MAIRLLIDECLSPTLEAVAHERGYEAVHVNHRGYAGRKDPPIFQLMLEEAYTLVTNNQGDFVRLIGRSELHPGLIVFTANVRRERQQAMLRAVLTHLTTGRRTDLVNHVVEVNADLQVCEFELPGH